MFTAILALVVRFYFYAHLLRLGLKKPTGVLLEKR